ncbi:MAG TPA: MFS transporter, partial [Gammaproteobacteria bacterium]|nr:MFS transporter [Gammaproteobacteria bacterium]
QSLHAASFGVYHSVAIDLVHRHFTGRLQGRGQALYSSVSFGAGASLGSLASGYLWVGVGPSATYYAAAAVAALAWLVAWRGLPAAASPAA